MNIFSVKTRLLAVILLLAAVLSLSVTAAADPYWALQSAYNKAVEANDPDVICETAEAIIDYYDHFSDTVACARCETPILKAAKIYEEQGKFNDAKRLYTLYSKCMNRMQKLTGDGSYDERVMYAKAFLTHYENLEPVVYVHASDPADVPYYGAKNEPVVGTYLGMCGEEYDETRTNAHLLYVQFKNETISGFGWSLPETDTPYLLEVAWNIPEEGKTIEFFRNIADGKLDDYLKNELQFLASLENCDVLLRFGAEVNEWEANTTYYKVGRLEEFKKAFIDAFRHIHNMAETYAPDVAMVYSPNDISNGYVTYEDFYPGDDYVDWVGFSTYGNMPNQSVGEFGSMTDAYYKSGKYANQMNNIAEIVALYGDRKPIMVSECGFLYRSQKNPAQTEAYAREKMQYFFAYINMLYPQVKAVFYFNTNFEGNEYKLFGEGGNAGMAALFDTVTKANKPIDSTRNGTPSGYTRLSTLNEITDTLSLAVYASYPGNPAKTVTYSIDGKTVKTTNVIPYQADISLTELTPGLHTLTVKTVVGQTTYNQSFNLYITHGGGARVSKSAGVTDVAKEHWAYSYVDYCLTEGFFEGLVNQKFSPESKVNRGMFVTLLGRAAGMDEEDYTASDFSDVSASAYYSRYVTWAKAAGVTSGTSDTQFSPNMIITREQICAMLVRYCDNAGIVLPEATSAERFADEADIADYFTDAVYRARAAGIISGKDGNRFDPKAELARQEIAVILKNFHEKFILTK